MSAPVIGIPTNSLSMEGPSSPGLQRAYVNQDYIRCVSLAGGVPLLLPAVPKPQDIESQFARVDALLLAGGPDLHPLTYGEQPAWGLGETFPEEDAHQLALARLALDARKPILAICRGMQLMNVVMGGTLHQDIARNPEGCLQHVQKGRRHTVAHPVTLAEDSRLARIFRQRTVGVNSFHHQAVKALAPGLQVTAQADDGIVEAVEGLPGTSVLGVQWHPEAMAERHPEMQALFQAWMDEAGAAR
ncbi:MAG TPA: gamma-glutamyl-gamma-aminobutyrate hydrolase family protein [Holophaga sp.]|nr:gamma-glutamyl-gamma-aminobutyrate hydrolase family protein [Holophaga sp.]HPS66924.1 gamma-glutamyl-gamma-aminobutyrate hydrolase family protein [Holophaga sp.]